MGAREGRACSEATKDLGFLADFVTSVGLHLGQPSFSQNGSLKRRTAMKIVHFCLFLFLVCSSSE